MDSTIIFAPTSTKNREGQRGPEIHQAKKGKDWHFGIKMLFGFNDVLGLIHSIKTTLTNAHGS